MTDEEEVEEMPDVKPQTSAEDLESGIFNLVITLYHIRASTHGVEPAKQYVSGYLERIASAIKDFKEEG